MGVEGRPSLFIDGEWRQGGGQARAVEDPRTGQPFTEVRDASLDDVGDAVVAARRAAPEWSSLLPAARADLLDALAADLASHADELAGTVSSELGAPAPVARALHVDLAVDAMAATAAELRSFPFESAIGNSLVLREPAGVVGAITPWNLPLYQVVAKVAPALAAGCAVVLKPSELTPLSSLALAEALARVGLPPGVLGVVLGARQVAEAIIEHPAVDMVSFTGSTKIGRSVAAAAGRAIKKVALELGGKSASVLLPDVAGPLLEAALKVSVGNCFLNSGQTCTALSRLLAPRDLLPTVEEQLVAITARYARPGRLGPLITAAHRDRVLEFMTPSATAGARLLVGGPGATPDGPGHPVAPTVYADVDPAARLAQEEIFGPVLSVLGYDSVDEAVQLANGTVYGLGAAVWSADQEAALRVARELKAGQVDVNGAAFNVRAPFGGYKLSGVGRELGAFGISEYLEVKAVQR